MRILFLAAIALGGGSALAAEGTFTLEHTPIAEGKPGQDVDFEAKLPAEGTFDVILYWRAAGGEWQTLRLESAGGGVFKGQLAGSLVTADIEYCIEAFDPQLATVKKGDKANPFRIKTGIIAPSSTAGIIAPEKPAEGVAVPDKPADEQKVEAAGKPRFIKGEITNLGGTKLVNKNNRVGLRIGYSKEGGTSLEQGGFLSFARTGVHMLAITPELDLRLYEKLGVGLGLPLRIPAYDPERVLTCGSPPGPCQTNAFPQGFFAINPSDFDELSEIARLIRYVSWGRKEDHLYVNVSQLFSTSIGHGTIMRRYFANANPRSARVGAEVDWYGDYGGFEAFTADILQPHKLIGAIAFLKPFGFSDNFMLKSASLGATYVADFQAPMEWEPAAGDPSKMAIEPWGLPKVKTAGTAQLAGLDLEMRVLELKDGDREWGNLKPYLDVSTMVLSGGGHGATVGALGRFNFLDPENPLILRFRVEGRFFQTNYLPGYFDSFYEIQKYSFITGSDQFGGAIPKPKLATVLGRTPANWTWGAYLEAQLGFKWGLAFTAAFETSGVDAGSNYVLHLEVPLGTWAQIFATYHRRSFSLIQSPGQFIDFSGKSPNTLVYIGARMAILPLIYINGRLYQTWVMERDETDSTVGLGFKNALNFEIDAELAWEWGQ
jgi:hypothetical protein